MPLQNYECFFFTFLHTQTHSKYLHHIITKNDVLYVDLMHFFSDIFVHCANLICLIYAKVNELNCMLFNAISRTTL